MEIEEITQQNVIGKMCWVYTIAYDSSHSIIVNVEQTEILKVVISNGKMYYTSIGIYPKCYISFTEIDAYRKAREHFETVKHNMSILIAQAEDKIKELEHKTKK